MSTIADNLKRVNDRIAAACARAGRDPEGVRLIAVSKKQPVSAIEQALAAGHRDFGENYVQEAEAKARAIASGGVRWHIIGHLQRNKVRHVVPFATMIHTVDSARLADEAAKRAGEAGRRVGVLVQVNVGGEEQKSGTAEQDALALVDHVRTLDALDLRGLMTMPPFLPPEEVRPYFAALRRLRETMESRRPGLRLPELSMGMSGDFEAAIEEGATIVRVGTAIFGERP
ncbi:MAG: YggS family pyridoxal phosphate-dependent enzyme [Deltaproteobacteria bacterium]|nr:YggS family pyridoxal phosphate-dependent enzyme [Deltaproteobacteria bacterium]